MYFKLKNSVFLYSFPILRYMKHLLITIIIQISICLLCCCSRLEAPCDIPWEYTETSKNGIQELFYYLETKRILINPVEMELKSWCAQSAIEMKREIASILSKYKFNSDTICWLRAMINACNLFLDSLGSVKSSGIIYKNSSGDWEDANFSRAMRQFRKVFKENILFLSQAYQIPFPNDIPD